MHLDTLNHLSYDQIIQNIKEIKDNNTNKHFSFVIRTNFSKLNISSIGSYIENLEKIINKDRRFSLFVRTMSYLGGGDDVFNDNSEKIADYIDRKVIFDSVSNSISTISIDTNFDLLQPGQAVCYAAVHNHFVIDTDGTVRKCTCNLDDDMNNIGILNSKGIIDMNYINYNRWIGSFTTNDECFQCSFLPICLSKNCPATVVYGLNSGCPYEKLEFDSIIKAYVKLNNIPEIKLEVTE